MELCISSEDKTTTLVEPFLGQQKKILKLHSLVYSVRIVELSCEILIVESTEFGLCEKMSFFTPFFYRFIRKNPYHPFLKCPNLVLGQRRDLKVNCLSIS